MITTWIADRLFDFLKKQNKKKPRQILHFVASGEMGLT